MALVVPKDGQLFIAESLRRGVTLQPTVGLFTGPIVPTVDTTLADIMAVEATYGGYARLTFPPWSPAVLTPSGSALIASGPMNFVQTAAPPVDVVTGYFVVQLDWALVIRLVAAERFGKRLAFVKVGRTLRLTIPFSVGSLFG